MLKKKSVAKRDWGVGRVPGFLRESSYTSLRQWVNKNLLHACGNISGESQGHMAMASGHCTQGGLVIPQGTCIYLFVIIYLLIVETEHRAPEYTKHVLYYLGHQPGELSYALLGFHANSWKRTLRGHLHAH